MYTNKDILSKIKQFNYKKFIEGGLLMSSYRVPDNVTKDVQLIAKAKKNQSKVDEINNKIDSISKKYRSSNQESVPDKIELERISYKKPTDEEIKQTSEELLKDYKNSSIKNIDDEYKKKEDNLYSNKSQLIENNDSTKQKLNDYYTDASKNVEAQALKRGLCRSSIVINQLDAFEKSKIDDYKKLDDELSSQINAINFELNALSSQKDNALNSFNISYAVKLQEKINSLQEELTKKENEVIKYNNEIAVKEAEFNKKVDELKNSIDKDNWEEAIKQVDLYGKYGSKIIDKARNEEIYSTVKEYLDSLSDEELDYVLSDPDFKKKMGDYYSKIYEEYR